MNKLFLTALVFAHFFGWAQNMEFSKKFFPNQKENLNAAIKNIKHGDDLFSEALYYYDLEDFSRFKNAIPFYKSAFNFNGNNAHLNYKLGVCILYTVHNEKSLSYLQKAFELDEKVEDDLEYYLAKSNQYNQNWKQAIFHYEAYLVRVPDQKGLRDEDIERINQDVHKKIIECGYGEEFSSKPVNVIVENVGTPINSEYPEYGVVISADESVMYFTSRRPKHGEHVRVGHEHNFMEDIYVANKNEDGTWSEPEGIGSTINGENHDATVALSPDGQILLVYKADLQKGGIYHCDLNGSTWGHPQTLKHIDTEAHESSACYSPDQKVLFFVSDKKEDNFGGKDIFYSTWNRRKAEWSVPKNLGEGINTKYDEEAVFMQSDGRTLYFSSQGHTSMGGHDVFKTVLQEDSTWSSPMNLGYPVNGPEDDVFLVMAANGRHAYYATHQKDSYGDKDIYKIIFLGEEKELISTLQDPLLAGTYKPVNIQIPDSNIPLIGSKTTILKGVVYSSASKKPIGSTIEIMDNETQEVIATLRSNSESGKYLITLPSGKNYGITVAAEAHLFHSENLDIPISASYNEIYKDITLSSIEVGAAVVLNNVFFDTRKWDIREQSASELNRLIGILNDYSAMDIEISGHTDNIGTSEYNANLSYQRAKSVTQYLTSRGISPDRLTYKGYGFDQPIATNETSEGRQLNRRTEFKIVSK
jgi:outer membrane protein OmpA-like peptidoglycan-associated protein